MQTSRRAFNAALASLAVGGALAACKGSKGKKITLGFISSWTDGVCMTHFTKVQLDKNGYSTELKDISEPSVLYTGLQQSNIDLYASAWPEVTHKQYMDQYGDSIEDLGSYYGGAHLTWSVPSYSTMHSISDLPDHADELDHTITGIEEGAGITQISNETVRPAYGLDDWKVQTSSTEAMITELEKAINAQKEIVVTLWHPFWAYNKYDVRDLEDPLNAFGSGEGLHFLARKGFKDDYPEIADWLGSLKLDETQYGDLESLVTNYGEGKEDDAATEWSDNHPEFDFKKS